MIDLHFRRNMGDLHGGLTQVRRPLRVPVARGRSTAHALNCKWRPTTLPTPVCQHGAELAERVTSRLPARRSACRRSYSSCILSHVSAVLPNPCSSPIASLGEIPVWPLSSSDNALRVTPRPFDRQGERFEAQFLDDLAGMRRVMHWHCSTSSRTVSVVIHQIDIGGVRPVRTRRRRASHPTLKLPIARAGRLSTGEAAARQIHSRRICGLVRRQQNLPSLRACCAFTRRCCWK